ncbi:MAG: tetratricopeptide repeat protein, partial [Candidatus Auribacterota bacterium]|nr:tetratricopeptide repeat protein [Candidatus Auribacterota bacterium]
AASLTAFLSAALLCSILTALKDFRIGDWIRSGLLAGLLILARPTLLVPGIFLWIIFAGKKNEPGRWRRSLLFLAGILIIIIPAGFYFSPGPGEGGFISTHGGENFYIGNNPGATGAGRIPEFARGTPALQHNDFLYEAQRQAGRKLTPGENSRFWFREGIRFATGHPFTFLKMLFFKIYLFFSANTISDNYHLPFFQDQLPILRFPFSWHLLSTLGLLGMITGWRRRKNIAILYISIACYVASIALFFVTARFRLPAAPYLAIFGAFGVVSISKMIRDKRQKSAGGLIMAAVLIFFGLGRMPEATPAYSSYLSAGEIYYRAGQYDRALSSLIKAREELQETAPENSLRAYRLHYALGQSYLGLDQASQAAEEFQRLENGIRNKLLEPDFDIGNAYAAHKFYREAQAHYLKVLKTDPNHFRAWNNLGLVYRESGDTGRAKKAFAEAIRINPDYAAPHTNLGNLYVRQEQYKAALNEFRAALQIDPALLQLHLSSAFCLQKLNQLAEARAEMLRCPTTLREKVQP